MSQASLETSLESLRHGLVFCDSSSLFEGMESSDIASCEERLQNTTGKSEELRKTYPLIESLAQIREADLDPMRSLALELRANCDDILLVGSGTLLDLARLAELFEGPEGRSPRFHLPRARGWGQQLLPRLDASESRVAVLVLGHSPGDVLWERTVTPAVQWLHGRYGEDEFQRRLVGCSQRSLTQLLGVPVRQVMVSDRAHLGPVFSAYGLLPLFLAGFEASSLIEGARSQIRALEKSWGPANPLVRAAVARQILTFQEGWGEVVVTPDRFCEPLGLWCQQLFDASTRALDPPLPYPFPHRACLEDDRSAPLASSCWELQLDYGCPELELPDALGKRRLWLGMPRLDMYTMGGLMAFLSVMAAIHSRWNQFDFPSLEH